MTDQEILRSDAHVLADKVQKIFNPGKKQTIALESIDCRVREGERFNPALPCNTSDFLEVHQIADNVRQAIYFVDFSNYLCSNFQTFHEPRSRAC